MNEVPQRLHVDIELEIGSDPIRGRLGVDSGCGREFRRWIELAAAIESVRNGRMVGASTGDYASADAS